MGAFPKIAFSPSEPLLLTIDGKELLAHDATTCAFAWSLPFSEPLLAVSFVDGSALSAPPVASPWRAAVLRSAAIALDRAGVLHVVDPTTGRLASSIGPFAEPTAMVVAGTQVALAARDRVVVWRAGAEMELRVPVSVLAFSLDGQSLALGAGGDVHIVELTTRSLATTKVGGTITALAQKANGAWLAGNGDGAHQLGAARLFEGDVRRIVLDPRVNRLALQRFTTHLAVFLGRNRDPELRVKYEGRVIEDLAFGRGGLLAVALDHGDADVVDIATSEQRRTERGLGAGRARRPTVYGYRERAHRR